MEVEYGLTLQDLEALGRFHLKHGPKLKPTLKARVVSYGVACGVAGLIFAAISLSHQPNNTWIAAGCTGLFVGFLTSILVLALVQIKLTVSNTKRFLNSNQGRWILAWRRLRISADGFEITSEFEQHRQSWACVWMIDSTDEHLFFYTTLQTAHVIPRRAFRDEQHFEDFIDLACRYHKGLLPRDTPASAILDALPAPSTGITRPPHS